MAEEHKDEQIEASQTITEEEPKKAHKIIKVLMILLTCFFLVMTVYALVSLTTGQRNSDKASDDKISFVIN